MQKVISAISETHFVPCLSPRSATVLILSARRRLGLAQVMPCVSSVIECRRNKDIKSARLVLMSHFTAWSSIAKYVTLIILFESGPLTFTISLFLSLGDAMTLMSTSCMKYIIIKHKYCSINQGINDDLPSSGDDYHS